MNSDWFHSHCILFFAFKRIELILLFLNRKFTVVEMKKKRQQGKRRNSTKLNNSNRSARIRTKDFEIFVTDFLTDPCGLPFELKDCVLVDGTIPINENSGLFLYLHKFFIFYYI